MSMRVWPLLLVLIAVVFATPTVAPTFTSASDKPIIAAPKPPHDCLPCTPYCKLHPNAPQCN